MAESIITKRDMYIMAPEPIETEYIINPSHYSVYLYMCIALSLLGNGSVKIPLSSLGNDSVKTLPRHLMHKQQYNNCWTRRFLCGPCRTNESRRLFLPRTSCLVIVNWSFVVFGRRVTARFYKVLRLWIRGTLRPYPYKFITYLSAGILPTQLKAIGCEYTDIEFYFRYRPVYNAEPFEWY
jgi:hypothetical protein